MKISTPNKEKINWNTNFPPKKLSEAFLQVIQYQLLQARVTQIHVCICRPLSHGLHLSIATNQHQQLFRLHVPETKPPWAGQTNQCFFQDNSHTSIIWRASLYPFWCISLHEIIHTSLPSWDNLPVEAILIEKFSAWSLCLTFYHPFRKPPLPFTSTLHICTHFRDSNWGGTEHPAQGQKGSTQHPKGLTHGLHLHLASFFIYFDPGCIASQGKQQPPITSFSCAGSTERFNTPQGPPSAACLHFDARTNI